MRLLSLWWRLIGERKDWRRRYRQIIRSRRPINASFYVEYIDHTGAVMLQHMQAKSIIRKGDELYVTGWCETAPSYRSVPVKAMTQIADDDTGELVLREDIPAWLERRSLN
jgi:hypothetical protein